MREEQMQPTWVEPKLNTEFSEVKEKNRVAAMNTRSRKVSAQVSAPAKKMFGSRVDVDSNSPSKMNWIKPK